MHAFDGTNLLLELLNDLVLVATRSPLSLFLHNEHPRCDLSVDFFLGLRQELPEVGAEGRVQSEAFLLGVRIGALVDLGLELVFHVDHEDVVA